VKVLLLAYSEAGELGNGPAIILTKLLAGLGRHSDIGVRIGLLKRINVADDAVQPPSEHPVVLFRVNRRSTVRSVMLRAALGGPLTEDESGFLHATAHHSGDCDVAVWLGLSWDPVSLKLPGVCRCPVIQHPTDSITLAESTRLPSLARPLRIRVAKNLETRVLKAGYAKSIYNSPEDAKFARSLVPEPDRERIVALPIGVDTTIFHPPSSRAVGDSVRVVFSGVMNYRPNVDAALALVRDVLPKITSNVEVRLIGRNPAPELLQLALNNPRVAVTGAVSDIAAELRAGDIFVAPMVSGGGISNKVLEAMASGLPVITTPLVADNFPDRPDSMWVANKSEDIAAAVDTLAGNADLRFRRASEAAEYIRAGNWSWQSRADRLIELLRQNARDLTRQSSERRSG